MKSLLVVSILVAMTASTLAQTTRTTSPEGTMSESQKGGPASRESKPNAGGQETVTKGAGPTSAKHRTRHRRLRRNTSTKIVSVVCACGQTALAQKPPALAGAFSLRIQMELRHEGVQKGTPWNVFWLADLFIHRGRWKGVPNANAFQAKRF